jgi:hypothetical protein
MEWIDLAQDRDQWRVLVNTVINLSLYEILGSSRFAAQLVASQERLSSIESLSQSVSQSQCRVISVLPHRNLMVTPSLSPRYSLRTSSKISPSGCRTSSRQTCETKVLCVERDFWYTELAPV